jgi:hypothetical protein
MKKWIFSAVIYLLVVIGGYTAYSFFAADESATNNHDEHETETEKHAHGDEDAAGEDGEHGGHGEHGDSESASGVKTEVVTEDGAISVSLEDQDGNPMDELDVNHEKLMHLIVISENLESFYHLHPEKKNPGVFEVQADLEEGMYQAFVDIKPSNLKYAVEPKSLMIGEHEGHEDDGEHKDDHAHLEAETNWTKEQNGYKATLNVESFSMKENVVLSFNLNGAKPENYLGALGHVVVVDEALDQFIHVHPASETEPVFEAHFTKPGMYKLSHM